MRNSLLCLVAALLCCLLPSPALAGNWKGLVYTLSPPELPLTAEEADSIVKDYFDKNGGYLQMKYRTSVFAYTFEDRLIIIFPSFNSKNILI